MPKSKPGSVYEHGYSSTHFDAPGYVIDELVRRGVCRRYSTRIDGLGLGRGGTLRHNCDVKIMNGHSFDVVMELAHRLECEGRRDVRAAADELYGQTR